MQNDVYEKVLRKRFYKTSLNFLDLRFKNSIFQDLGVEARKERKFGLAR